MSVSWLWSLAALPILGVLATILWQLLSARSEEHRKLRREGAEVVIPVKELVNGLGPEGIMLGTDEQVSAYLDDCFKRWWNELREPLMIYVNHYPSGRVRALGEELATDVGITLASTRYHFLMRKTAVTMEDFEQAANAKAKALAKADELLAEIRRSWPGWLRRPKWTRRSEAPAV
jgi:hypothetical protein